MIEIEQADGGYIIHGTARKIVFVSFSEVVQYMAKHFNVVGVGEDWKP